MQPEWKQKQIAVMLPAVKKLVTELVAIGILTLPDDEPRCENILFVKGHKTFKLSFHSFYRFSGILQITRTKKDSSGNDTNWTEVIPVTNEQYIQMFIKPIIIGGLEL